MRLLQGLAVFAAGAVIIGGAVVLALLHLAGWRDPESEEDFERLVVSAPSGWPRRACGATPRIEGGVR